MGLRHPHYAGKARETPLHRKRVQQPKILGHVRKGAIEAIYD